MALTKSNGSKDSTANIGFEAKLWLAADKLRNNVNPHDELSRKRSSWSIHNSPADKLRPPRTWHPATRRLDQLQERFANLLPPEPVDEKMSLLARTLLTAMGIRAMNLKPRFGRN